MAEYEAQRQHLWPENAALLNPRQLPAARKARQLLRNWMAQHLADHSGRERGEELAMMEEALKIIEAEKAAEPVAA